MTIALPLAIENYLRESGLSDTEMLVMKHLLAENFLTVRELSSKTGKGNSAIDAALKKLIQRGIVSKEKFNDQPKYTVLDPQSIVAWAEKNLHEHAQMMQRHHQNLEQFVESLNTAKSHPAIEHFEGEEGIMKAYDRLLQNRVELLTYFDPASVPDSDQLTQFHTQYARRRQVHGVFQRIIAPDSPVARRFRTRDPFEYRKTVLVSAEEYPLSFDKIIAGDVVACVDEKNMEASFIRFEKLADAERKAFEQIWGEQTERDKQPQSSNATHNDNRHSISLREQVRSMNIFQKVCTGFFAMLCVFWAGLVVTGVKESFYNYFFSFLFCLVPLVSGAVALFNFKRWDGFKTKIGRAVNLVGLGLFMYGCGGMAWSYYNFFLNIELPYPSIADLGFASGTILFGLGVTYLSESTGAAFGLKNVHAKIFAIVAPIIVLVVSYYLLIIVARSGVLISRDGGILKLIIDLTYPILDFLILTAVVIISGLSFQYMKGLYALDIWMIIAGIIAMFVADFIFSYTTTTGTFYVGQFGDIFYAAGLSFLSFGLLGFCKEKILTEDKQ